MDLCIPTVCLCRKPCPEFKSGLNPGPPTYEVREGHTIAPPFANMGTHEAYKETSLDDESDGK